MAVETPAIKGQITKPYIPPLHVDVYVDAHDGHIQPEHVELESSDQVIRWTTNARDIHVVFDKDNPIRGARYRRGNGTCELSEIPTGNLGTHKYTVSLMLHDGSVRTIDPDVIVKY
jgi:hypothetical protein